MTTLEARGYQATDDDISKLAKAILDGEAQADTGRTSYLRTLVAVTQKELGAEPRQRMSKADKLKAEGISEQLAALTTVHDRFYALVLEAAGKATPANAKDRATEVNRKTNFARTALYAVRSWIRAGHDVTALAAAKVTKAALAVKAATPKPQSVKRIKARVERESKALVSSLMALADSDKGAAVAELNLLMNQVTAQLLALAGPPVADAAQAAREHKPLRIKKTVFMPTETQVLAQIEKPS
jgi:hypothetical protein